MTSTKKAVGYGLLTWIVPFVVSFGFYNADGDLRTDIFLFKSIMIVVAALVSSFLLVKYFSNVTANGKKEGLMIGLLWFVMNLLLDVFILFPLSDMSTQEYIYQIGLRYLIIPVMATAFGALVDSRKA